MCEMNSDRGIPVAVSKAWMTGNQVSLTRTACLRTSSGSTSESRASTTARESSWRVPSSVRRIMPSAMETVLPVQTVRLKVPPLRQPKWRSDPSQSLNDDPAGRRMGIHHPPSDSCSVWRRGIG